jgi:hypothetical protein
LSKPERKEFCQILQDLKVPLGCSSNFKRLVSVKDMKMNYSLMKSHDCHVLMTTLLSVALRGIKIELVHDAVTSLCLFFNAIEQKVIDGEKLLDLERRHFKTLYLLEASFPPSFFDLMLHLTTHQVKVKNNHERSLPVRPPGVEKTSRLGSRDPVADGVKCGLHGGKNSGTKSWTVSWLSLKTKVEPGLRGSRVMSGDWRRLHRVCGVCSGSPKKPLGYSVEPQNQGRRLDEEVRPPRPV